MGSYTVVFTDENGCVDSTSFTIESETQIVINHNIQQISCYYNSDGFIDISVEGGVTPYNYNWVGPNDFTSSTEDIQNLSEGNYEINIIDNNNCSISTNFNIILPDTILIQLNYPEIECANGEGIDILSFVSGGAPPYSFEWDDLSVESDLLDVLEGVYILQVTDNNLCTVSDTATVITSSNCLNIPTGITPNNDGINDVWIIRKIEEYPENKVMIFNDHGAVVYSMDGYTNKTAWDATMNGKILPSGIYYFFVQLSPEQSPLTGSLSIIK